MPWLLSILCVLGLVVLFFPFVFRIEFSVNPSKAEARFFFFKKHLHDFVKLWGKGSGASSDDEDSLDVDDSFMPEYVRPSTTYTETKKPQSEPLKPVSAKVDEPKRMDSAHPAKELEQPEVAHPAVVEAHCITENSHFSAETNRAAVQPEPSEALSSAVEQDALKPKTPEDPGSAHNILDSKQPDENAGEKAPDKKNEKILSDGESERNSAEKNASEIKSAGEIKATEKSASEQSPADAEREGESKPEKRPLTEKEFWTLLLTPDFDSRAFSAFKSLLGSAFSLFHIKFRNCYVEGIRMTYEHMGYGAAFNAILKSYPYIGDWDIRMDWTYDHEPSSAGEVRGSLNLCRVLGFFLVLLFHGSVLALSFWRRRRHVLRTNELPELGFIRNKIVDFMVE